MHFTDVPMNVIYRLVANHHTLHHTGTQNARRVLEIIDIDEPNNNDVAEMKKLLARLKKNNWQLRETWEELPHGVEDIEWVEVFDPEDDVVYVECTPTDPTVYRPAGVARQGALTANVVGINRLIRLVCHVPELRGYGDTPNNAIMNAFNLHRTSSREVLLVVQRRASSYGFDATRVEETGPDLVWIFPAGYQRDNQFGEQPPTGVQQIWVPAYIQTAADADAAATAAAAAAKKIDSLKRFGC